MTGVWAPRLIVPLVLLLAFPAMSPSTWLTLTVAGAATGMMLFLMASGLTLIFGLMDVLNFAHGAFITLGAFVAASVLGALVGWGSADSLALNLSALGLAVAAAAAACAAAGFAFERGIVRHVHGSHLRQILITMGGLIVAGQLIVAVWGAQPLALAKPLLLRGSVLIGGAAIERYRLVTIGLGLAVFGGMAWVLGRTRIGLLVRAGVENREMVESLGFRIRRLNVGVFVTGTALAGVGGAMWAVYQEQVTAAIGADMTVLVFIVVILGGLGSVTGCFAGSLLVGLVANYVSFLAPKLALGSNIAVMMLVLLWRPRGLFPVGKGVKLLSGDGPGHPVAVVLMAALLAGLIAAPFLFPGARALATASEICVFIVLAASYDLLLGTTGIVSFAHTMFYGIGAYGVAIPLANGWVGFGGIALGATLAVTASLALAVGIGLLSLRVQAIFFSMITLAVASFFQLLATQNRWLTGGEDGLTFAVPRVLSPAFRLVPGTVLGVRVDGRIVTYYLVLTVALALFLMLLRVVNAPFGRVLKAIRENAFRAEALGYRVVVYRTLAGAVASVAATLAGVLAALSVRYTGPETTLSFSVMVDVLLMVVIGGMGTLYGPALGAAAIVLAQHYLQPGMRVLSDLSAELPLLASVLSPDRWLLWLGVLFIATVYFFPAGIVGTLRARRR